MAYLPSTRLQSQATYRLYYRHHRVKSGLMDQHINQLMKRALQVSKEDDRDAKSKLSYLKDYEPDYRNEGLIKYGKEYDLNLIHHQLTYSIIRTTYDRINILLELRNILCDMISSLDNRSKTRDDAIKIKMMEPLIDIMTEMGDRQLQLIKELGSSNPRSIIVYYDVAEGIKVKFNDIIEECKIVINKVNK